MSDDDYEEELEEDDLTRIILQPLQRFVGEMGPVLLNITALEVHMEVLGTPPPSDDSEAMPDNLARKLNPIKFVTEQTLSILALACSKIHTLSVVCPEVLYAIPFQLLRQVTSFAIGTYMYRSYTEYRTVEFTSCHLKPFLARLTSLTLLPSSSGHELLAMKHLRDCRSLTRLDCGNHRSEAIWAVLPPGLRELHSRFSHPDRGNHIPPAGAYAALPPGLRQMMLAQAGYLVQDEEEYTEPSKLTQLTRWVITDWESNWTDFSRRELLVLDELVHVLELAPNLREIVLQRRHPYKRELASVVVLASTSASLPSLARLHDRVASGLRFTTEYWPTKLKHGGPPPSPQGFQLQLTVFGEEPSDDEDEEDESLISLSEYFSGMRRPCPAFTHIFIKSGAQAHLKGLHLAFPNVSMLAVSNIDNLKQLAHLAQCRSLTALEVHEHCNITAVEMAAAISRFKYLRSFTVGTSYGYHNYSGVDKALLKQLLSKSKPGLLLSMA